MSVVGSGETLADEGEHLAEFGGVDGFEVFPGSRHQHPPRKVGCAQRADSLAALLALLCTLVRCGRRPADLRQQIIETGTVSYRLAYARGSVNVFVHDSHSKCPGALICRWSGAVEHSVRLCR